LRPTKRGSIQAHFETGPDLAVALATLSGTTWDCNLVDTVFGAFLAVIVKDFFDNSTGEAPIVRATLWTARNPGLPSIRFSLGAFKVAWRYIAWARGDLDAYVLSGILVEVFMVARLAFGRALKSRSR
jgi:hypothetical protein